VNFATMYENYLVWRNEWEGAEPDKYDIVLQYQAQSVVLSTIIDILDQEDLNDVEGRPVESVLEDIKTTIEPLRGRSE
jgi:pSer/pThr/pTyr-binding forkhead associated (FHA) protein